MPKIILNVCNGNIHRSVIATLAMEKALQMRGLADQYSVTSRGLLGTCGTPLPIHKNLRGYSMEWSLTLPALEEFGIMIPEAQATTPIARGIAETATLILAMDKHVLNEKDNSLCRQFPDLTSKIHLFSEIAGRDADIPDPFGINDADLHRRVVETICSTVNDNLDKLMHLVDSVG